MQRHGLTSSESIDRAHNLLKELRSKYAVERAELIGAVTEQVADVRSELDTIRSSAKENAASLEALRRQVRGMTQNHDGPADLLAATREANERLVQIRQTVEQAAAETSILKSALLGDRIRREERRRKHESEDAEVEVRLRQVEEVNAAARVELHTIKATNIETLQSVADMVHECKFDAPTVNAVDEMRRLKDSVLADLERVRHENSTLVARMNSMIDFGEREEQRRSKTVDTLEAAVREIEARPPPPVSTPSRVLPHSFDSRPSTSPAVPQFAFDTSYDGLVRTPRSAGPTQRVDFQPPTMVSDVRTRVAGFYAVYNPQKLATLDAVLREYAGAEEELMSALEVHYGAFGYFSAH